MEDIIAFLLAFEGDPNQRGMNDYTAVHMAVSEANGSAVHLLLDAGAELRRHTRIDTCDIPGEMAQNVRVG